MTKPFVAIIGAALCAGGAAAGSAPPLPSGAWTGTAHLTRGAGTAEFPLSIAVQGRRAMVSRGAGHAARTQVAARLSLGRVRLTLPGRPWRISLDGRVRGRILSGTFRQGPLRGSFRLRRGPPLEAGALGLYRFADGSPLGAVAGFGTRVGFRYDQSEVRGLYRTRRGRYAIGSGIFTRSPEAGTAVFGAVRVDWNGERAERVTLREEEVWVRSGRAYLACTLTIPAGGGRRPALTFAHGAGIAPRAFNSATALYANHLGLVTLSCDKRGVAQSGGTYPGEFPSEQAVDQYARDVGAQARFLTAQPEVDPRRVGVAGASQAGWIMPRAAVREPRIHFMIGLVSPTLTQRETDLWANLNRQGEAPPTRSDEEMEAEVRRAGPSGVDPMPSIRAMRIPAIWLFGAKDRTVPTRLCIERLDPVTHEPGRDFRYVSFPGGTHGLIKTENGLLVEQERSNRLVDGLYSTIRNWLAARGFSQIS